jgi:hypothetical protein
MTAAIAAIQTKVWVISLETMQALRERCDRPTELSGRNGRAEVVIDSSARNAKHA